MTYTLRVYKEIWGDEREPQYSVSHKFTGLEFPDLTHHLTVAKGLSPDYRIEIEPEYPQPAAAPKQPLPKLVFHTNDGYKLTLQNDDKWTDGDLKFETSQAHYPWPIDLTGDLLDGRMEAVCE